MSGFDFDGDGALELVYVDETSLRLYRGRDGAVASESLLVEACDYAGAYAVVADVDGDGAAEIVAGRNNACAGSLSTGLVALGGAFPSAGGSILDGRPGWE